ncbi:T9SS type A sorting domain-containing protein [Moheibacter sediminis]|uniref:Por secretion system C-terminal sorting domain-containing protein n=1 Tax=Moheibacter sediminis TaxID=1434700 RepID=A0A1W1Y812_9FLAO|nr:T9SS type A sorting domain-containing protein [Moheibacter sediminis]SMC32289.1 Por secretion system C-terminal sorting domain-containing protein [Moheibacter sediminis]
MKKISSLKNALLLGTISLGAFVSAQVKLNELTDFGTSIYDINNDGKGVHGNGYYDFTTNSSSSTETGVVQTVEITNSGQVLGLMADESGEIFIPALKNNGAWAPLANMGDGFTYTLYAISENGMYVVGQTDWTVETGAWGFIYNTQTETLKVLDSPLYEYGAAYGVNNEGIAVGWVDDLPSGTVRMPAYFDEEGNITLISEAYGEASNINDNNEIVGSLEGVPFLYKIAGEELTTYEIPSDYLSAAFADISDNGIAVGYAETFIEGQGGLRNPIIFHPNLGAQPIFLADFLNDHDIDTSTFDGIGYKISSDGKYIAGWISGPAFMATGWAVYLDDAVMSVSDLNTSDLTFYPNPVKDILNLNSKSQIQKVSVYNLAGQQVMSKVNLSNAQLDVTSLSPGVYVFRVTLEGGQLETFKIIKK